MRRPRAALGLALILAGSVASLAATLAGGIGAGGVWAGEIRGTIDPATADFLETTLRRAQAAGAAAVVFELDTPGGLLSSVRSMAQAIDASPVPVIVFTAPGGASATSAGALLMMASHVAAMAPGTNIGAAHPVGTQGEDIKGTMGEKITEDTAAFARSLAQERGRNVELSQDVVSKSRSFTATEALQKRLIDVVAESRGDLLAALDGRKVMVQGKEQVLRTAGAAVQDVEMTAGQKLMHWLANPNVAGILMTLGMLLIYVEFSHPGISIAGILGGLCFIVAFMAFQILPIRVGGLACLLLGAALMLAEPFVVSHGALAGGGVISFVLGLIWVIDPSRSDLTIGTVVWASSGLALGTGAGIIGFAAARARRLSKETLLRIGGGALSGLAGYDAEVVETHKDGTRGKVRVRGEIWNFESPHGVQVGEAVTVTSVHGFVLKVKRAGSGASDRS